MSNNNNDHPPEDPDEQVDPDAEPLLTVLMGQLRDILRAHAGDAGPAPPIDVAKARMVLEASADNVRLAAQLYWDDFLANQVAAEPQQGGGGGGGQPAAQQPAAAAQPRQQPRRNPQRAAQRAGSRRSQRQRQQRQEQQQDPPAAAAARAQRQRQAPAARDRAGAGEVVHRLQDEDEETPEDSVECVRVRRSSGRSDARARSVDPVRRSLEQEFQRNNPSGRSSSRSRAARDATLRERYRPPPPNNDEDVLRMVQRAREAVEQLQQRAQQRQQRGADAAVLEHLRAQDQARRPRREQRQRQDQDQAARRREVPLQEHAAGDLARRRENIVRFGRVVDAIAARRADNNNNNNNNHASANISDDENNNRSESGRQRTNARLARKAKDKSKGKERVSFVGGADAMQWDNEDEAALSPTSSPEQGRYKRHKSGDSAAKDDEDPNGKDGYLSDHDWMFDSLMDNGQQMRSSIPLTEPMDILWGGAPMMTPSSSNSSTSAALTGSTASSSSSVAGGDAEAANEVAAGGDEAAAAAAAEAGSNVIADDDGDEGDPSGTNSQDRPAIPTTWLQAGFSLNSRGSSEEEEKKKDDNADAKIGPTGLQLNPPSENDMAYLFWRHRALSGTSGSRTHLITPPPPYHCRALSGLLSIVTALLYTGSAPVNNHVICGGLRRPFGELDERTRRREFEARLADAISSLLLIAAKASLERKRRAIAVIKKSKDEDDQRLSQQLERKINLCPTCSWETEPQTDEVKTLDTDRALQIQTSYTNIHDLREYVVSNIKSFTGSGGCALLLETILRIHGRGCVMKMVRHARRQASFADATRGMIDCSCNERHKKELEASPPKKKWKRENLHAFDTTPLGHECMSVELLSLVLTGRVHSTFQGWSTGPLGFGILSSEVDQMDQDLRRPEKPVWMLRGPTCYSVLVLNTCIDDAKTFSIIDQPGAVSELTHWNCWYGMKQHNKTTLRLLTGRTEWSPPKIYKGCLPDDPTPVTRPKTMTEALNLFRHPRYVSADGQQSDDAPHYNFSQEELDRVLVNPEDEKFYPGKFRMWRYDMRLVVQFIGDEKEDLDKKPRASQWTPFYRLNKREQLLVETKLGPQIKPILLTRWPHATIDKFDPPEPAPVV